MKKQEDARLAVLREYDKWAKDHPNDAKKMGAYVFFGYLEKKKARPSRFPCRREQMANRSPLASSRRWIEGLRSPAPRSLKCFGLGQRPRHVTGRLVDAALDSA